ncbi:3-(3-hydroxy-phenyl)propionate hydroxylase [Humitalea rosea]|uniref:3-(3-hydroxy-phenyl)propionate hydroxylase n=1 Tax=Humitalea rosea TaxID=990373 RepID=A0A2W7J980_9PROT|nr:FAD-dependent oxidoreductase [Humitalea rosea]PZW48426.1 3-(3-hydroxy-phenyl)propionate hydroxylase [Humitalea rosea]
MSGVEQPGRPAFQPPRYASPPPPRGPEQRAVVIIGAGLVGLTLALDLARRGVASVVLDDDDTVSVGSRAICFAKRSLEIFCRLGLGEAMLAKGVTWQHGRVFFQDREAYRFDLLPEAGHECPAFINLQQYYAEAWLVEACAATGLVELRWKHRLAEMSPRPDGATLTVETPAGGYVLEADWLLACDGARSRVREALALPFTGRAFRDRFLIADVVMQAEFPTERWFWFDPPFHPGQSVLLHKQPDDLWRIDFQLGWEADPEAERDPDRVTARVRSMLGPGVPFRLEWVSVYSFRCRRLERFVHGRTVFLGDSAHQVSPFGARGGNGGIQDADNLGWKLAAVLRGEAGEALIASYDAERVPAAAENILHSTRSTDFISPKTPAAQAYRDAVLDLAEHHAFARPLVNSGRLSRPAVLAGSPLNTPDGFDHGAGPGTPAPDAPVAQEGVPGWLLRHLGAGFCLLVFAAPRPLDLPPRVTPLFITPEPMRGALHDHSGLAAARFGAPAVLLRPDQHVVARFLTLDAAGIAAAHDRAMGRG